MASEKPKKMKISDDNEDDFKSYEPKRIPGAKSIVVKNTTPCLQAKLEPRKLFSLAGNKRRRIRLPESDDDSEKPQMVKIEPTQDELQQVYSNIKFGAHNEIHIQSAADFNVYHAQILMHTVESDRCIKGSIKWDVELNTVYVVDTSNAEYIFWEDDYADGIDYARDYYFKGGELRPHRQNAEKVLRVRIFWLRDRGLTTGVRRIIYLDPSEDAYKNLENWTTKRVVIGFFGVGNPNISRPRISHGNSGRRRTTRPAPMPPKLVLLNQNDLEDTKGVALINYTEEASSHDVVKEKEKSSFDDDSTQYHKTSNALKSLITQEVNTCGGSSQYSNLVLKASKANASCEPPRNLRQIYNHRHKAKIEQGVYNNDFGDVLHLMNATNRSIVVIFQCAPLLIITKNDAIFRHLNELANSCQMVYHYDTTFNIGDYFASILSVRHPLVLTSKNQNPIIPVAMMYHEKQDHAGTHGRFFQEISKDLKALKKSCVIVTDREKAIVKSIAQHMPKAANVVCYNHLRTNVRVWTAKKYPKPEAVRYRRCFRQLLWAKSVDDLNSSLLKFCGPAHRILDNVDSTDYDGESFQNGPNFIAEEEELVETDFEWDDSFKNYYFSCLDRDVRANFRGSVAKFGIFSPNSGVTNNASENYNMTLKSSILGYQKIPTLYSCIFGTFRYQNRLLFDVQRGLSGSGGEFHLLAEVKNIARKLTKIVIPDAELLFIEAEREKLLPASKQKIELDSNFDAKVKIAAEYYNGGLVKPLYFLDLEPTGLFAIKNLDNKYVVVQPQEKYCSCGNNRCFHKIAVQMLTGQFGHRHSKVLALEPASTLSDVYKQFKAPRTGKKDGQLRLPQCYEESPPDTSDIGTQDDRNNLSKDDDGILTIKEVCDNICTLQNAVQAVDACRHEIRLDKAKELERCNVNLPKISSKNSATYLWNINGVSITLRDLKSIQLGLEKDEIQVMSNDGTPHKDGWMNDNAIFAFLSEITRGSSTKILSSAQTSFLLEKRRSDVSALKNDSNKPSWTESIDVFFIFNPKGCHWVLLHASRPSLTITCYNSLNPKYTLGHVQKKNIETALNQVFDLPISTPWGVGTACNIPQQKDDKSCGPYVCYYAECIIKNVPTGTELPCDIREFILKTIVGKCDIGVAMTVPKSKLKSIERWCGICRKKHMPNDQDIWIECHRCGAEYHHQCASFDIQKSDIYYCGD